MNLIVLPLIQIYGYFFKLKYKKIPLYLMLKERIYNLISCLFIGLLIVYLINKPPVVFITHPNIDNISEVTFINENDNNMCSGTKSEVIEC